MLDLKNKLEKARINLYRRHFFLGSVLFSLETQIDTEIPTAAVNGVTIRFNPDFVKNLSDDQLVFLYAHEVMHVVLKHHLRIADKDPEIWNVAGDYVINQLLMEDNIGNWIEGGYIDAQLYEQGNKSTEGIYNILIKEITSKPLLFDTVALAESLKNGTKEDYQEAEEHLDKIISQSITISEMAGTDSSNIARYVRETLYVRPDCLSVLTNYLEKVQDSSRTFSRANRRFLSLDLYLASKGNSESIGPIAIAIDCSGSVSDKELAEFRGTLESIRELFNPSIIKVIYFDYVVCNTALITRGDPINLKFAGGGGTSYANVWKELEEDHKVCLVLTDMDCGNFGTKPDIPVVWISTDKNPKVPFGKVVSFYNQF